MADAEPLYDPDREFAEGGSRCDIEGDLARIRAVRATVAGTPLEVSTRAAETLGVVIGSNLAAHFPPEQREIAGKAALIIAGGVAALVGKHGMPAPAVSNVLAFAAEQVITHSRDRQDTTTGDGDGEVSRG